MRLVIFHQNHQSTYTGRMKRATITLTDDLERAIEAYSRDQDMPPPLTSVVQAALRQYLAERGYMPASRRFYLSPARKGSGRRDISERHDEYLAQIHTKQK